MVFYFFLNQSVGSNDQIDFSGSNLSISFPLLLRCCGASQQNWAAVSQAMFAEQTAQRLIMLNCQNFRGDHKRRLIPVLSCQNHSQKCQYRFSTAYVSLYQPGHQTISTQILLHLTPNVPLRFCETVGQIFQQFLSFPDWLHGIVVHSGLCLLFKHPD